MYVDIIDSVDISTLLHHPYRGQRGEQRPVDVPGHEVDHQPVGEAEGGQHARQVGPGPLLPRVVLALALERPLLPVLVLHRRQHPLEQVVVPT